VYSSDSEDGEPGAGGELSVSDSADGEPECSESDADDIREPQPRGQLFASLFRPSAAHLEQQQQQHPVGQAAAQDLAQSPAPAPAIAEAAQALGAALFILSHDEPDLTGCQLEDGLETVRQRIFQWSAARGFGVSQSGGSEGTRKATFLCRAKGRRVRASDAPRKDNCLPENSRKRRTCVRAVAGEENCPFR
jgi:hypothetical protein